MHHTETAVGAHENGESPCLYTMSTKTPGSSNARPGGIFGAQRGGPQNVGQFKDPAGAAGRRHAAVHGGSAR